MTTKPKWIVIATAIASVAYAALRPRQPDPLEDWVLMGNEAVGFLSPIAVADGIQECWWSGDGRNLLFVRREPKFKLAPGMDEAPGTLETWSLAGQRRRVVMRLGPSQTVDEAIAIGNGNSAIVRFTGDPDQPSTWMLVDSAAGSSRPINLPPAFDREMASHPSQALLAFAATVKTPDGASYKQVSVLDARGATLRSAVMPDRTTLAGFTKSGGLLVWRRTQSAQSQASPAGSSGRKLEAFELVGSGQFQPVLDPGALLVPEPATPEQDRLRWTFDRDGGLRETRPVYMKTDPLEGLADVLVAADVDEYPRVASTGEAVMLQKQGVVLVRPMVRMPKDQFLKALLVAQKTRTMSNAKQVGVAIMIYSADFDDVLPSGPLDDKIDPYLKNRALLRGFVYTFSGGDISQIDKPAETELGFMPGPGGRAILYADGHVKWRPDSP